MNISFDTTKIQDPNKFGELLREYFFTKEGIGCYSNFEVEPFMFQGEPPASIKEFFGDCENAIHFYISRDNQSLWLAWTWDGDGTLIVSDGERIAENHDCKKGYGWRFLY